MSTHANHNKAGRPGVASDRARSGSRRKALSVPEVILSIAFFAMAVVSLTQSFSTAVDTLRTIREEDPRREALPFIRTYLLNIADRGTLERGGTLRTPDMGEVRWRAEIEPTEVLHLYRIQMELTFMSLKRDPLAQYKEVRSVLRPSWSGNSVQMDALLSERKRYLNRFQYEHKRYNPYPDEETKES